MSTPLVTVEPREPIDSVLATMSAHGIRRAPVVRDRWCSGVVSADDALLDVAQELQDLALARQFKPVTEAEMARLVADSRDPGGDGKLELWKTTDYGGRHHREQHEGIPRGE